MAHPTNTMSTPYGVGWHIGAKLGLMLLALAAISVFVSGQTYTDLHDFYPQASAGTVDQGPDGNFYGNGAGGVSHCGIMLRLTPDGDMTVLHEFGYDLHGRLPSGLTLGADRKFYGVTVKGGVWDEGTIFSMTSTGDITTLYSFRGGTDGNLPHFPPIEGVDGNFYGTAFPELGGVFYRLVPSGGFIRLGSVPDQQFGVLLLATDGNFYGTSAAGGDTYGGTVFKVTPGGVMTIVHSFSYSSGSRPYAPLLQGRDGNFYGTTLDGGRYGGGVVFKLTAQGTYTVLHNFGDPTFTNDSGSSVTAGLIQANDGNYYGVGNGGGSTGHGALFKITPRGTYSIVYSFDWPHGAWPRSTPRQHTNGKIYGLTEGGGQFGGGVFYSFDLGLQPFIRLVSSVGRPGNTIDILGQGLTGTISVSFNGAPAEFSILSDTDLIATVPDSVTTGPVSVTTPSGTLVSDKPFHALP